MSARTWRNLRFLATGFLLAVITAGTCWIGADVFDIPEPLMAGALAGLLYVWGLSDGAED